MADGYGLMSMIDPKLLAELLARQGQQGQPPNPFNSFQRPTPSDYANQRYGTPFDHGPLLELLLDDDKANRIATGRTAPQENALWNRALGAPEEQTNFDKSRAAISGIYNALIRGARP